MRWILALVLLALPAFAEACAADNQTLVPNGSQQLTVSSTALGLTVPANTVMAYLFVNSNTISAIADGTTPTATVGGQFGVGAAGGGTAKACGTLAISQLRMIRVTSDASVNAQFWRVAP